MSVSIAYATGVSKLSPAIQRTFPKAALAKAKFPFGVATSTFIDGCVAWWFLILSLTDDRLVSVAIDDPNSMSCKLIIRLVENCTSSSPDLGSYKDTLSSTRPSHNIFASMIALSCCSCRFKVCMVSSSKSSLDVRVTAGSSAATHSITCPVFPSIAKAVACRDDVYMRPRASTNGARAAISATEVVTVTSCAVKYTRPSVKGTAMVRQADAVEVSEEDVVVVVVESSGAKTDAVNESASLSEVGMVCGVFHCSFTSILAGACRFHRNFPVVLSIPARFPSTVATIITPGPSPFTFFLSD